MNQLAIAVIVPSNYWRPVSTKNSSIVSDYIPNFGQAASGRQCGPYIPQQQGIVHHRCWIVTIIALNALGWDFFDPACFLPSRERRPSECLHPHCSTQSLNLELANLHVFWILSFAKWVNSTSAPSFILQKKWFHSLHSWEALPTFHWMVVPITKLPTTPKISISSMIQQLFKSEESNLHCLGSILRDYASLSYKGTQLKLQNFSTDNPNQTMIATHLRMSS